MRIRGSLTLVLLLALAGCAGMQHADTHFQGTTLPGAPAPAFSLTSDTNAPWSLAGQRGKTVAVFFGYTHCADTCPATLAKLAKAIAQQGSDAAKMEVAFVTVDPQRDTPAVMHSYIARFTGGTIVGLTGTPAHIASVEHAYHVWAQKIPGKHTGTDDYDDAHSSVVYFVDRDGNERVLHGDDDSLDAFASDLHALAK